jgi:hypothetical protein
MIGEDGRYGRLLDLVSVDLTTNACVDSSDFSVAYWG